MKKHKVAELEGALLDAAVAKAEGRSFSIEPYRVSGGYGITFVRDEPVCVVDAEHFEPSSSWGHGGPIIERERISLDFTDKPNKRPNCCATINEPDDGVGVGYGSTALESAMRAYVASKFGEEVDLP